MKRQWIFPAVVLAVSLVSVTGCDKYMSAGGGASGNTQPYNTGTGKDFSGPLNSATDLELGNKGLEDHHARTTDNNVGTATTPNTLTNASMSAPTSTAPPAAGTPATNTPSATGTPPTNTAPSAPGTAPANTAPPETGTTPAQNESPSGVPTTNPPH